MYEWLNKEKTILWKAVFSECCKHKWTIIKYVKKENGRWKETEAYKRFDTLEDARSYALKDLGYKVA